MITVHGNALAFFLKGNIFYLLSAGKGDNSRLSGLYGLIKSVKVMEFENGNFQAWKSLGIS